MSKERKRRGISRKIRIKLLRLAALEKVSVRYSDENTLSNRII